MLKIGIIGLGDIALKAYLPVVSKRNVEIHLCTRNVEKLRQVGEQYRIEHRHSTLESLLRSGVSGAFVHSATPSHEEIVEALLSSGIHVFVDKPLTYTYTSTEKLVNLALKHQLLLHVGFNRRYAPAYQALTDLPDPGMIIMQKNRKAFPGELRAFVFDDFIHVIDTLLYLFPHPIKETIVHGKKVSGKLYHVVIQLVAADGVIAIGIMNRDSGTLEEKLEVFTTSEKYIVYDLVDTVVRQDKNETRLGTNDWATTLYKRGFDLMIDDFLQSVGSNAFMKTDATGILLTHKICETVVERLKH